MAKSRVDRILKLIKTMTIIELRGLVRKLEEAGLASAPALQVIARPQPAVEAPFEEEQTGFAVFLTHIGSTKTSVVKAVKMITGFETADSLQLVNRVERAVPIEIKSGISRKEAEAIAAKLEEAGATVEIRFR